MCAVTGTQTRVRNDLFDPHEGFDRGRPTWFFALWYLVKCLFFLSSVPWPSRFKAFLLRRFGARLGRGIHLKPRINIYFPWRLSVGDYTWLGEEACIINFAPVIIGAHCCLSQRSTLCSGNHDYRSANMRYRHAPIILRDGVWIGAGAFVGPGVTVGTDAVVTAMSSVNSSLEGGIVYSGQPCKPVRRRWLE
jgi:putative colanic acid biosynthesis acetyltransferase WcaF